MSRTCAAFAAGPLLLAGCSTHPLPEDVTGLPIFEIVHQIQCEAAQTVRAIHRRKAANGLKAELDSVKAIIAKKAGELRTKLKTFHDTSDFGTSGKELEDAHSSVILQLLQVAEGAARVVDPSRGQRDETLMHAELDRLKHEKEQLEGMLRGINAARKELGDIKRLDDELTAEGKKLTKKVKKGDKITEELTPLAKLAEFESHKAFFEFVFQVTEDNNATSKGTITWPIDLGVITLGYDVGDKKQRASDRKVRVISTFAELVDEEKHNCWDVVVADEERFPRRYPITGRIGLEEVILDYLEVAAVKGNQFKTGGESYTDAITFTTTVNGGLKPGINLSKRTGQLIQAEVDLAVSRKDVHKVTIYLTPPDDDKASSKAQEIIIKQMPAVRTRTSIIRQPPSG